MFMTRTACHLIHCCHTYRNFHSFMKNKICPNIVIYIDSNSKSFDPCPSPKASEYIHNHDYKHKLRHKEWLEDEALKAKICPVEKKQKEEKHMLQKEML